MMDQVLKELASEADKLPNAHEPWNAPGADRIDDQTLGEWLDAKLQQNQITSECRNALELEFSNTNGGPTNAQSLLFNLAIIKGGGVENYWDYIELFKCARGNDALANSLRGAIIYRGGKVSTSTPVTKIKIGDGTGCEIAVRGSKENVHFDYIVLATPPTTWRKIHFDPPLKTAHKVTMGTAIKFMTPMKDRLWIREEFAPTSTSENYGVTWEATDNQTQNGENSPVALSLFSGGPLATIASGRKNFGKYISPKLQDVYPVSMDTLRLLLFRP